MDIASLLRSRGIRPSQQRIRIYGTLASTKTHPSAEVMYDLLSGELATLSRTTVYSSLERLVQAGLARRITSSVTEFRFDADVSPHAHFLCRICGGITDVESTTRPVFGGSLPAGYVLEHATCALEGLCAACASSGTVATGSAGPAARRDAEGRPETKTSSAEMI